MATKENVQLANTWDNYGLNYKLEMSEHKIKGTRFVFKITNLCERNVDFEL
jgi:hypothetical protein